MNRMVDSCHCQEARAHFVVAAGKRMNRGARPASLVFTDGGAPNNKIRGESTVMTKLWATEM
jgi:hypothetical protein